jgi:nondiscriminating aspartyl-tRNA synthetase
MSAIRRTFVADLHSRVEESVTLRGWILRLRVLAKTTFVILKDCSGEAQCVAATDALRELHLKLDNAIEIRGNVRRDARARFGTEIDVESIEVLNRSANVLPFNSSSNTEHIGSELLLEYRPLALRSEYVGDVFRIQAAILKYFRNF